MNEGVAGSLDSERGERLRRVRLLLLDVDGVMTDGGLYYAESGGEFKRFDVKDGAGIYLAMKNGLEVGILTARTSEMVSRRAEEFGLRRVFQGAMNKGEALSDILADGKYGAEQVAFMGDDVLDLPVFRRVGFTACPADAHELVRHRADYVCSREGGSGAVREFIDLYFHACGVMELIEKKYWEDAQDA